MGVFVHSEELTCRIQPAQCQLTVPGPDGDIGDAVMVARQVRAFAEAAVEHIQLALGFHGEAVDRVLELLRCIGIEMSEATAQVRGRAHLPEQPVQSLGALRQVLGQEVAEFFCQVQQDRAGLEDASGRRDATVEQGRDLRVGVDLDKTAGKLIAFANADEPSVVFGAATAEGQQFFKQYGDLYAIGGGQGIKLQGVFANREHLVMGRSGDGSVDVGKFAARRCVVFPDLRWDIGCFAH
ncbi:hypothetical protein D3C79_761010 [compost metagenome]